MAAISHRSVAYALVQPLVDNAIEIDDNRVDVVFENDHYQATIGQPYIQCEWKPGAVSGTLNGSVFRDNGIMRFEIWTNLNEGATFTNALVDDLISIYYHPTTRISRDATTAKWDIDVISVKRSETVKILGWRHTSLDVVYIAVGKLK